MIGEVLKAHHLESTDRAIDLANAWQHSRAELIAGSIGSIEGAKERSQILKQAEIEGLLDAVVSLIGGAQ